MDALTKASEWQRQRAMLLQQICAEIKDQALQSVTLKLAMHNACKRYAGTLLGARGSERPLKLSVPNLRRIYKEWQAAGETIDAFKLNYVAGKEKVPADLVHEYQRLASLPGQRFRSVAFDTLVRRWVNGDSVPGLGTWSEWWMINHRGTAIPIKAPDFPYAERSLLRYKPRTAIQELGSKGIAAMKRASVHITRTIADLRPCELFVLDDKRIDLMVIDDITGKVSDLCVYLMMEVSSHRIAGYTSRPGAMNASDVDALIARVLQQEGYGRDYPTHILIERGTVAMSPAAQQLIESVTDGKVKIHRTSMDAGMRALGFAPDEASGHWQGKGIIESYCAKIDRLIMHLPGQRGNRFENQPSNLAHGQRRVTDAATGASETVFSGGVAAEAEALARIEIACDRKLGLDCDLLWMTEFNAAFRQIIKEHNTSRDHGYEGFGHVTQAEVADGVWEDVP